MTEDRSCDFHSHLLNTMTIHIKRLKVRPKKGKKSYILTLGHVLMFILQRHRLRCVPLNSRPCLRAGQQQEIYTTRRTVVRPRRFCFSVCEERCVLLVFRYLAIVDHNCTLSWCFNFESRTSSITLSNVTLRVNRSSAYAKEDTQVNHKLPPR